MNALTRNKGSTMLVLVCTLILLFAPNFTTRAAAETDRQTEDTITAAITIDQDIGLIGMTAHSVAMDMAINLNIRTPNIDVDVGNSVLSNTDIVGANNTSSPITNINPAASHLDNNSTNINTGANANNIIPTARSGT